MSAPQFPIVRYTDAQRSEAAEWFVTIRAENDPNAESLQAWLKWMDLDEGNRAAFDAVTAVWQGTPDSVAIEMPSTEALLADDYDGEQPLDEWLSQRATNSGGSNVVAISKKRFAYLPQRAWLAAASVLIAIAGLLIMNRYTNLPAPNPGEFVTRTGEQIEITLSDGSHVWLGPKSVLRVAFSEQRRNIQLKSGEAFFSVKKDHSRPFVVQAAGGDIVAVGTAFNVRAIDEHVTVAVSEGVVAVTPKAESVGRAHTSVKVASGQQLTFTAEQPVQALTIIQSPAVGERARWRDGILVYRDESLQEVVGDIVRYSDVQIEIADAAVGNLHYSGVVYHDAVREWIAALPESFPVTVVTDGTREIIKAR